jgi:hypothetical protein
MDNLTMIYLFQELHLNAFIPSISAIFHHPESAMEALTPLIYTNVASMYVSHLKGFKINDL